MNIARVLYQQKVFYVAVEGENFYSISGSIFRNPRVGKRKLKIQAGCFLPPVVPSKIVLVGLNYRDHCRELGMKIPSNPIIFLKPPSALIGHQAAIIYPEGVCQVDYEAELALVIKKEGKNISPRQVKDYVLGYCCFNDVTARDIQKKEIQWSRAKSFDTFAPVGPMIVTHAQVRSAGVRSYVNGVIRQNSTTDNFIFPIEYLVSFISKSMTLFPGDIISTGTPPGIGKLEIGDRVDIEVDTVGKLSNFVRRGVLCSSQKR